MLVVGLDEVLPKSEADEEGLTLVRYEPCLAPTFLFLHFVEAFLRLRQQGGGGKVVYVSLHSSAELIRFFFA